MEFLTIIAVPTITTGVYALIEILKKVTNNNETVLRFVPLIALGLGAIAGVVCYYFIPDVLDTTNVFVAIVIGAASGLAATGTNQVVKQLKKADENKDESDKAE
jgi:VIT1/CCC1 family predicted Fe2+/Mn2+ transporter